MAREFFPGVGEAVAARTILRPGEKWGDVARRVAEGNESLDYETGDLEGAIADGRILLSGRHLQHGDANQSERPMEVFTNCSTASQRALLFYLLLNGSGVGTSYDDDMCVVDWSKMPKVVPVLSAGHPDYTGEFETIVPPGAEVFVVPDSREGWAQSVQHVEDLTFMEVGGTTYIDFSQVREKGAPIRGMQDRPSSGPVPLMQALAKFNDVAAAKYPRWRQAMELDHLLAEIVLVGGARRAARIAVKWWGDPDIHEFINIKQAAGLWTANNSVGVDADFWSRVRDGTDNGVFRAIVEAQYRHGTGEPGFLNLDLISRGETANPDATLCGRFEASAASQHLRTLLAQRAANKAYPVIVNPCGEIRLSVNGGYCVIGDIALAFCQDQNQFNEAVALVTRSLIRTNLMPAMYQSEVDRTNRIGVALTGIHEYAWNRFGLTFHDLVAEGVDMMFDGNGNEIAVPAKRALPFWHSLMEAAHVANNVAGDYCEELSVEFPTTLRTIKPAGTTSKLFGLTEGAHLPSMREYLRWVQFRSDSPMVEEYLEAGYPVRDLETYKGTTIVGFPTRLLISEMMGPNVVTATEATPEQQIRWIRLIETYWLLSSGGNQVSYTLKYDPTVVDEETYAQFMLDNVPLVRAVSIMPQIDATAYEYQPEEPITAEQYDEMMRHINKTDEDIGLEHVGCSTGACPVDFKVAEPA